MRKLIATILAASLALGPLALSGQRFTLIDRTTINVKRVGGEIELSIDGTKYSKRDFTFQLAEKHVQASPKHRVLVFLDEETARISDIALVTQCAVNAGFTDIEFYVIFHQRGTMAQLVYGSVEKISDNPGSRTREKRLDSPRDQAGNLISDQN
jgi:hypothetical protein